MVYRFIDGRMPSESDFLSHYERQPDKKWAPKECQARGLSILRTLDDCIAMRQGVPALRKKSIAEGTLVSTDGLIAPTPSKTCTGHCTWWRHKAPNEISSGFKVIDEIAGGKNV
jgi:hypothetical protein